VCLTPAAALAPQEDAASLLPQWGKAGRLARQKGNWPVDWLLHWSKAFHQRPGARQQPAVSVVPTGDFRWPWLTYAGAVFPPTPSGLCLQQRAKLCVFLGSGWCQPEVAAIGVGIKLIGFSGVCVVFPMFVAGLEKMSWCGSSQDGKPAEADRGNPRLPSDRTASLPEGAAGADQSAPISAKGEGPLAKITIPGFSAFKSHLPLCCVPMFLIFK
jgi:hypothetical protein